MSESDNASASGEVPASGGAGENQEQNESKYPKHFVDKLMSEKKKAAAELEETRRKLQEFESEKLSAQGKQSELIESLKKQLSERDQKLNQTVKNFAQNAIYSAIKTEAQKHGCVDPEALIRLADLNSLEVDTDTFQVDQTQLSNMIASMSTEKPYLFKKSTPSVKDAIPQVNKQALNGKTNINDLPLSERIKLMAEMSAKKQFAKNKPKE